jgi:hypothetical protein
MKKRPIKRYVFDDDTRIIVSHTARPHYRSESVAFYLGVGGEMTYVPRKVAVSFIRAHRAMKRPIQIHNHY